MLLNAKTSVGRQTCCCKAGKGGENTKEIKFTIIQKIFGIGLCNNIAHCLLCALACRTGPWLLNKSMKIFVCFACLNDKQLLGDGG